MTKKVLLVGSSFSAAPIFFALKKRGFHVTVCGNKKSDPCHQYADESVYFDYSDSAELYKCISAGSFDYVVPSCNDYAYMACAKIADACGIFGFDKIDVAEILHKKNKFRSFTEKHEIPAPKSIRYKLGDVLDVRNFEFPLLLKPVDNFSGRGIIKVNTIELLPKEVDTAFKDSGSVEIVIEEYVEGPLHSHSAFFKNGKVIFDVFVDEFCTVYPYQVNCSNHPSAVLEHTQNSVRKTMEEIASLLSITDGLLHTQFISNGERYWIIECMRRSPGDLYGHMIELSTDVEYTDLYVKPYINEPYGDEIKIKKLDFWGRHTLSVDREQVNFTFSYDLPSNDVRIVQLKSSGEILGVAPYDKMAIIFSKFSSYDDMVKVVPNMHTNFNIYKLG